MHFGASLLSFMWIWGYYLQSPSHPPVVLCYGCRSLKWWGVRARRPERGHKRNGEQTFLFSSLTSAPLAGGMHCEPTSQPGESDISDHLPTKTNITLVKGLCFLTGREQQAHFSVRTQWAAHNRRIITQENTKIKHTWWTFLKKHLS